MRAPTVLLIVFACACSSRSGPGPGPGPTRDAGTDSAVGVDAGGSDGGGLDAAFDGSMGADASVADAGVSDAGSGDSGSADAGASGACTVEQNPEPPTDVCSHGSADWLAWEWIAPGDMVIDRVEIHTDAGDGALLDDDAGQPKATLATGPLSAPDAEGWRSFTVSPPVSVSSGQRLWIAERVGRCSVASGGPSPTYYGADTLAGPWRGPYSSHMFTARLHGTCP